MVGRGRDEGGNEWGQNTVLVPSHKNTQNHNQLSVT